MANKVGDLVGGKPWGYGASGWQQNVGKYYDPSLPGKYFGSEAELNAAMPKPGPTSQPYNPTQSVGGMPLVYNPANVGKADDPYTQAYNAYQAGETDQTYTPPSGNNTGMITINNKNNTSTTDTSLQDLLDMLSKLEYKKTDYTPAAIVPYGQDWNTLSADLKGQQEATYADTKAKEDYQTKTNQQAAKDLVTGRGLGRSSIAASYIAKPAEQEQRDLDSLLQQQAGDIFSAKQSYDTAAAQNLLSQQTANAQGASSWANQENEAANQFNVNKGLLAYQTALDEHNTAAANDEAEKLAKMGVDANKELTNLKSSNDNKVTIWKLLGL